MNDISLVFIELGFAVIGQAVIAFKGKVEYFINNVFNYPTLAECYKTAAFDGINRLGV